MKIIYRPHFGMLEEAMKHVKEFNSLEELQKHVSDWWNEPWDGADFVSPEDVIIGEVLGPDPRIGWKEVRHVLVKRMGDKHFGPFPQAVGHCEIRED